MNKRKMIGVGGVLLFGMIALTGCANPLVQEKAQTRKQESARTQESDAKNVTNSMHQNMGGGEHMNGIADIAKGDLDDAEKNGIIQMREEEKLARDVYTTLGAKWGQNSFLNITSSEQMHMDEVKQLIDRYALTDPVTDGATGIFTSPEMQKLYNDLVAKGNVSLVEALKVGATVEDMDIKDLQDLGTKTDNADIKYVYENLKNGSQRHLQSFVKNIEKNGLTYTPQYISQTDYDVIIAIKKQAGGKINGGCAGGDSNSGCGMHDGSGSGQGGKVGGPGVVTSDGLPRTQ